MDFKNRLKELRLENNLTQQEIANILDISKSSYIKYEHGNREPSFEKLLAMATYYNVPIDFLLGTSDERSRDMNKINKSTNFIRNIDFDIFGDYKQSILKMASDYSDNLYGLDMNFFIDLLFMFVTIQNKIQDIYAKGTTIFIYNDLDSNAIPKEQAIIELHQMVTEFKSMIDRYGNLLLSKEFYHEFKHDNDYFFADEIKKYKNEC